MTEYFFKIVGVKFINEVTNEPLTHVSGIDRNVDIVRRRLTRILGVKNAFYLSQIDKSEFPLKKTKSRGRKRKSTTIRKYPREVPVFSHQYA